MDIGMAPRPRPRLRRRQRRGDGGGAGRVPVNGLPVDERPGRTAQGRLREAVVPADRHKPGVGSGPATRPDRVNYQANVDVQERRSAGRMTDRFLGLRPPYGTILADPPWPSMHQRSTYHRGSPERHYTTMPVEDIAGLDVASLTADDGHRRIWGVNRGLEDATHCARLWGVS